MEIRNWEKAIKEVLPKKYVHHKPYEQKRNYLKNRKREMMRDPVNARIRSQIVELDEYEKATRRRGQTKP